MQVDHALLYHHVSNILDKVEKLEKNPLLRRNMMRTQFTDAGNGKAKSLRDVALDNILDWFHYLVRDSARINYEMTETYMRLLSFREGYVDFDEAERRLKEVRKELHLTEMPPSVRVPGFYKILTASKLVVKEPPKKKQYKDPNIGSKAPKTKSGQRYNERKKKPLIVRQFSFMNENEVQQLAQDVFLLAHMLRDPNITGKNSRAMNASYPILIALQKKFKEQELKRMPRQGALANSHKNRFDGKPDVTDEKKEERMEKSKNDIEELVGLTDAKNAYYRYRAHYRHKLLLEKRGEKVESHANHLVFVGNPGTAKTTFAHKMAKDLYHRKVLSKGHIVKVNARDLIAPYLGQTENKVREILEGALGGILFIDEAYALAVSKEGQDSYAKVALTVLLDFMEEHRDELIVIAAGYPGPMKDFLESNDGLPSRFGTVIEFKDYDLNEMMDIFDYQCRNIYNRVAGEGVRDYAHDVIQGEMQRKDKNFGNGRFARKFLEHADKNMALRLDASGVLDEFEEDPTKEDTANVLKTMTLADVKAVDLEQLRADIKEANVEEAGPRIGFNAVLKPV